MPINSPLQCSFESSKLGLTLPALQAAPDSTPAQWQPHEELQDLYSVYIGREGDADKQATVASMLGIPDNEARSLAELVAAGSFKLEQEAEEEAFF